MTEITIVYACLIALAIICATIVKKITDSNLVAFFYLLYEMLILFIDYLILFVASF